jgi:hypothetical protein
MTFYNGQSVRIILPNTSFHNQTGIIIKMIELAGSDSGCGTNITVKLNEDGYEIDVNIFSRISIEPLNTNDTSV